MNNKNKYYKRDIKYCIKQIKYDNYNKSNNYQIFSKNLILVLIERFSVVLRHANRCY